MDLSKVLAQNLKLARTEKNVTQQALATACKVTVQTIRDIEAQRRKPSFDLIEAMAKALGLAPSDLVHEDRPVIVQGLGTYKTRELMAEVTKRMVEISEDICEKAELLGIDNEVWDEARVLLDDALERLEKARKAQA